MCFLVMSCEVLVFVCVFNGGYKEVFFLGLKNFDLIFFY